MEGARVERGRGWEGCKGGEGARVGAQAKSLVDPTVIVYRDILYPTVIVDPTVIVYRDILSYTISYTYDILFPHYDIVVLNLRYRTTRWHGISYVRKLYTKPYTM